MADLFQPATKPGFHRVELLRAVWEVPLHYQDLQPIGTGAYGSVMLVLGRDGRLGRRSLCASDLGVSEMWMRGVRVYRVVLGACWVVCGILLLLKGSTMWEVLMMTELELSYRRLKFGIC